MEDGLRCAGWFFGELNSPPLIYLAFLGRVRLAHNVLFGLVGPWEAIRKLDLYKFTSKHPLRRESAPVLYPCPSQKDDKCPWYPFKHSQFMQS